MVKYKASLLFNLEQEKSSIGEDGWYYFHEGFEMAGPCSKTTEYWNLRSKCWNQRSQCKNPAIVWLKWSMTWSQQMQYNDPIPTHNK